MLALPRIISFVSRWRIFQRTELRKQAGSFRVACVVFCPKVTDCGDSLLKGGPAATRGGAGWARERDRAYFPV